MKIAVLIVSLILIAVSLAVLGQTVAPQKVFENASVRVEVLTLTPGAGTGRHQSVEAEVGIVVEGRLPSTARCRTKFFSPVRLIGYQP
jgi:hypothetical protein